MKFSELCRQKTLGMLGKDVDLLNCMGSDQAFRLNKTLHDPKVTAISDFTDE